MDKPFEYITFWEDLHMRFSEGIKKYSTKQINAEELNDITNITLFLQSLCQHDTYKHCRITLR